MCLGDTARAASLGRLQLLRLSAEFVGDIRSITQLPRPLEQGNCFPPLPIANIVRASPPLRRSVPTSGRPRYHPRFTLPVNPLLRQSKAVLKKMLKPLV